MGGKNERALLRSVLGEVLRRARLKQGRTLADVALAANISMPYLSEVERGLKEVSSEVLAALCEALGVDLSDILLAIVIRLTGETTVAPQPIEPARHGAAVKSGAVFRVRLAEFTRAGASGVEPAHAAAPLAAGTVPVSAGSPLAPQARPGRHIEAFRHPDAYALAA